MAIRYDPRLYTAGSAVFNPEPITQATAYVSRYRQAKNDALDEYYKKRMDSVNGAGMRTQDIPDFNNKLAAAKEFYLVNKDKLRKGDVIANANYDKLLRDTEGLVAQSKERTAAREDALKAGMELRKEGGTVPDSFMTDLEANDLPVSDQKGKKFDIAPYVTEPKPFDLQKELKKYDDIPRTPGLPKVEPTDPSTGKRLIKETETFDEPAKQTIQLRAGAAYQNDRSFQREVNRTISDPAIKKQIEEVYSNQFGHRPESNEQYATGYIMAQKDLAKTTQKLEDDKMFLDEQKRKQAQADRVALAKLNNSLGIARDALKANRSKDLAKYRHDLKGLDDNEQANVLDKTFQDIEDEAKKNGKMNLMSKGQKVGENYVASVPDLIKGELGRKNDEGKLQYPDQIAFNPDGTIKVIYFKEGSGNHIDNSKSHTITRDQFKAIIGKKLFGAKTTSGADYGNDSGVENDDDEEQESVSPLIIAPTQKSTKKKIPGF